VFKLGEMIAIKFFTHPMIPPDDERAELKF